MSDHEGDPELQAAFDELSESVGREVDVDSSLAALERSTRGGPPRSRRPLLIGVAAAVVLLVIAGSAVLWTWGDDGQVVSADRPDVTASTIEECVGEVAVYLMPSATQDQIDQVGELLEDDDQLDTLRFVDRAETYDEFTRLFSDSPEFVGSIDPAELPQSYRLELTRGQFEHVQRLAAMPEVMRIEATGRSSCDGVEAPQSVEQDPGISPEDPGSSEATTTTYPGEPAAQAPATTAPPPVAVDRAPDIKMGNMTLASAEVPLACVEDGDRRTPEQEALGCPPPGEQIVGTVTVDGITILVTSTTGLFGCGPTDGAMVIPFSEVVSPPGSGGTFGPVAVWFVDPSAGGSLPLVRAAQLSIGSCG